MDELEVLVRATGSAIRALVDAAPLLAVGLCALLAWVWGLT
jgi:hypothetical protein